MSQEARRIRAGLLFISPWLLGFLVLTVYPVIASAYYSFTEFRVLSPPKWVGLRNYAELFTDRDYFLPSLANTVFMFIELPIALALSVGIALLLNQKIRGMAFFRTLFYLPSVVPTVATAILWLWLLNPEYGLVNRGLGTMGIPGPGWLQDPVWSKPGFIVMNLWMVGGNIIIYLAALQGVPEHLYEAAELDGASAWSRTWHVTLPAISPVIFFNLVLGVINTFQYFTQPFMMTGSPGTQPGGPANSTLLYPIFLFQNAFAFFRMGYASAMAWILFLITVLATLLVFKSTARWVYYEGETR